MGKIVLIDIDGTLVDYDGVLPASAVRAIRTARKNGHKIYLCSGRSKAENSQEIWDIGIDGYIGGNGSYVEDGGQVVMHQLITLDQCRHIVDWLHSRGLEFYLESNNGLFASERFREAAPPVMREYSRRKGAPPEQVEKTQTAEDAFPAMIFGGELYRDDVNKVSFILHSYQDHLDSIEEFPDLQPGTWGGAGETALFGDLGVKGITKAHAVEVLLRHLNGKGEDVSAADTVAIGDAKVDIPMLECCAVGVAMGSGGEEIKAMADYVTDDVDKDGLFKAFAHLGLLDAE